MTGGMISEQRKWEMKQDEMKHLQTLGEMMRGKRRGGQGGEEKTPVIARSRRRRRRRRRRRICCFLSCVLIKQDRKEASQ